MRRSSIPGRFLGATSDVMTICLSAFVRALNVLKNSSWKFFMFMVMNWISSMRRTSIFLYLSRNVYRLFCVIALMYSLRKASAVR